jgi:hypothetical protein
MSRTIARRYLGVATGDVYIDDMADAINRGAQIVVRMRPERWLTADYTAEWSETASEHAAA